MRLTLTRFMRLTLATIVAAGAREVAAQRNPGVVTGDTTAVVESRIAREAFARATAAVRAKDSVEALAQLRTAARIWPLQPAYPWARAVFAARVGQSTEALNALLDYAVLGLGRDLRADRTFDALRGDTLFERIATMHDRNRATVANGAVRATIADSAFWPEGMDVDPRSGTFYVASVRYGTIAEVRKDGRVRELLPRNAPGMGSVLGVRVDTARNVLWATVSGVGHHEGAVPGDSAIAALLRVRISDGKIERRWDIPPVAGGHVLGDVAIGPKGDVFFTDSNEPVFYWLSAKVNALQTVRSPLFRSLQGMAPAPDGRIVYVADYSHGLLRLDLLTRDVTYLAPPPGSTLVGCDGLVWYRGGIVAVQNGVAPNRVVRISLSLDGRRATSVKVLDQNPDLADEPTIGAMLGDQFVYVGTSQWEKWDDANKRVPGARAPEVVRLIGVRVVP